MATYTYNEELADGGYVRFNVSPASGWIGPGMTVTVSGVIKDPFTINRCVMLGFATSAVNTWVEAYKNLTIKKNVETTFSISVMITYEMWDRYKVSGYTYTGIAPFLLFSEAKQASGVIGKDPSDISGTYIDPTSAAVNTWLIRCVVASAPTIPSSPVWTDEAAVSALTVLGNIVTVHSLPRVAGSWAYDSHYPDQLGHVTLTLTGAMTGTYEKDTSSGVTSAVFDLPTPENHGTVNWTYTVTDMFGNTATATGNTEIKLYYKPAIRTFYLERYDIEQTSTGSKQVPADDGEYIWLSLLADIASVNELNAWNSTMTYWKENDDESEAQNVPNWNLENTDGETIDISNNDEYLASLTLAAQYGWKLRLTITDALGYSDSVVCDDIQKAGAVFDVEPNGVAVGMRSTATELEQKFECAYPAQFFGNVAVPNNGLLKVVRKVCFTAESIPAGETKSGTVNITSTDTGEGWTAVGIVGYSSGMSWFNVHRLRLAIDSNSIIEYSVANVDKSSVHNASLGAMVLCVRTSLVDT